MAGGGDINPQVAYIEFLRYLDDEGEPEATIVRSVSPTGRVTDRANWTMRQADQLVASGNWTVEVFEPPSDKPDDYGVEVW